MAMLLAVRPDPSNPLPVRTPTAEVDGATLQSRSRSTLAAADRYARASQHTSTPSADRTRAAALYEKVLRLAQLASGADWARTMVVAAQNNLAVILLDAGEAERAMTLLVSTPQPTDPKERARYLFNYATALNMTNHYQEALEVLAQAAESDPTFDRASELVTTAARHSNQATGLKSLIRIARALLKGNRLVSSGDVLRVGCQIAPGDQETNEQFLDVLLEYFAVDQTSPLDFREWTDSISTAQLGVDALTAARRHSIMVVFAPDD